uniref:Transcobalamin-like C-terminal domain-containing protein n=1 Tax=Geospiza parvula TaxID=87175 RepID=A0A8C3Q9E7_GEOPR
MPSTAYSIAVLLALASATVTQGCGECQFSCSGTADRPVTLQEDEWMMHRAPGDLPSVAEGCQATVTRDHLVQKLLQRMEKSVKPRTAGSAPSAPRTLHPIPPLCPLVPTDLTSGQVALYVLALLSSCQDPRHVHARGKTINLIPILKQKMNKEISKNGTQGLTTWYTESLDILALCLVKEYDNQDAVKAVAEELLKHKSSPDVGKGILQHNGMIGDIYSMGLALQALETSSEFYAPRKWDRAQAFSVVYNHEYQQPMAIAQVLPPLVGKSYLNAGGICQVPTLPFSPPAASITVQFSITNTLKNYFHYSTSVCVPDNSTLLQVMKVARNEKPDIFRFKTKKTSWGPFVTSIHGLAGNDTKRTYWQFFSCWSPLQEGVGTYKPKNWEHIQAIFSTY